MHARPAAFLALVLPLVLTACSQKTSDRDLQLLDVNAATIMATRHTTIWVDPRSEAEFALAHIPGAISMPFGRHFEATAKRTIHPNQTVIVYASSVQDVLGVAASKRLMELGLKNIYTLAGGLRQWARAGNRIEGSTPDSVEQQTTSLENLK
jgi:rhodanese-related sulfurtransferase